MAAPTIQTLQATTQSTANSVSALPPAGIVNGDLMLAIHSVQDASSTNPTTSPAAGWTDWQSQLGWARNRLSSIYRIASGESGNYVFSSNQVLDHILAILRITGHSLSGFAHQQASAAFNSATTFIAPEVITTLPDCLILFICNYTGLPAFIGTPAGCTQQYNNTLSGETGQRLGIFSKSLSVAGPSGTGIFTCASIRSGSAMTLAIAPATSTGSPHHYYRQEAAAA